MKNTLLLAAAFLTTASVAQAQITLTAATHMPVADTTIYASYRDTLVSIPFPATGANVTWNYATVVPNVADTTRYFGCVPLADCATFSNADLLTGEPADTSFQYYKTTGNIFQDAGLMQSTSRLDYTDIHDLMRFPFTYTNSYVDTFSGIYSFDALPFTLNTAGIDSISAVGYGMLTTPLGTYNNVLLVRSNNEIIIDASIFGLGVLRSRAETYSWYEASRRAPVCQIIYFNSNDTNGVERPDGITARFINVSPSAVSTVTEANFRLAPNPSTGNTRMEVPASFNTREANVVITDLTGKTVYNQALNGATSVSLSTEGWARGLYLVRLQNAEGKTLMNKLSVQ